MQINYWNEIELVSQASLITLISVGIAICFIAILVNLYEFYRNESPFKVRTALIQLFVVSILTAILVGVENAVTTASPYRNAKIATILTKFWHDRESSPYFWNTLQSTYKCCGVNGSTDWEPNVPVSCYQSHYTGLFWRKTITCPYPHENGCYGVIVKYFDEMTCWFELIGMGFIFVGSCAIFGLLFTLLLNLTYRHKKTESKSLAQI